MNPTIVPHVLCGGFGTRLWPMSREAYPKQFVPLINGRSLLVCTLERAAQLGGRLVCIGNAEHRFLVDAAFGEISAAGNAPVLQQILEPIARNTAAAMACAALLAAPDELLLFLPADHYIPDVKAFAGTIHSGVAAAQAGYLVTFGVTPSFPSTAYGYIKQGTPLAGMPGTSVACSVAYSVARFVEKPNPETAQQLLLAGGHVWNAGIFLVRAQTLVAALEQHAPDILAACRAACAEATHPFGHTLLGRAALEACRSESIDYAVLEKHERVAVLPFAGAWSDVGSWNAVAELTPADAAGNRLAGQAYAFSSRNVFIRAQEKSAAGRPVVALGLQDTIIVDTPDALLVAHQSHAEAVKDVVRQLNLDGAGQTVQHRKVARPWGFFDSVDAGPRHQVKRITVKPGEKLSLQLHHHRAEHWVVVKGTARVTRGDEEILLSENQSTYIPLGVKHRLENPGKTDLEIIEVQSGSYLGEDDIVRFEDHYGRQADGDMPGGALK